MSKSNIWSYVAYAVAAFLLSFVCISDVSARVWRIIPDGSGDRPTIQDGIDVAASGDSIVLAPGIFSGPGNSFVDTYGLKQTLNALVITSETGPESTIIECGEGTERGIRLGYIGTCIVSGVTITGAEWALAGGQKMIVENCVFEDSEWAAITSGSTRPPVILVSDCVFRRNHQVLELNSGELRMWNCVLDSNNLLGWVEGDRFGTPGASLRISDCVVTNNLGPLTVVGKTTLEVNHSMFSGNTGPCIEGKTSAVVKVRDSVFAGNTTGDEDGVVSFRYIGGNVELSDNEFANNVSTGNAGAIYARMWSSDSLMITGNVFRKNTTIGPGGAIYMYNTVANAGRRTLLIENNTFVENHAQGGGSAIYKYGSGGTIGKNIFAFNGLEALKCGGVPHTLSCNNSFANVGGDSLCGIDGGGNFSADPMFCGDDFGLSSDSPCSPNRSPCGELVGAKDVACEGSLVLDLLPRKCPNRIEIEDLDQDHKHKRLLPLVLYGSDQVDARDVDRRSLMLEGVKPTFIWWPRDEGAPAAPGCECGDKKVRKDGNRDLRAWFELGKLAEVLRPIKPGETRTLTLTGTLKDGSPFSASDCIVFVKDKHDDKPHIMTRPPELSLGPAVPNPFNPITRIRFSLKEAGRATLVVYDVEGRQVATLVDQQLPQGDHDVVWDARGVASGVYFYRLTTGSFSTSRKVVLMK